MKKKIVILFITFLIINIAPVSSFEISNEKIIKTSFDEKVVSLIQKLDENIYLSYLENLTSFGPKVTSTQGCEDAGEYIYNEFIGMGLETRYHEWDSGRYYGNNIEGTIPGTDENSDEIYIICAHYDTVSGSPGADDDGSGVAAVLSAAKLMSQCSFKNAIRFVTFSGEEQGLYGSTYYAEEASENNDSIIAVLNADMIGFAESENDESLIRVYEDDASTWITEFTINISEEYNEYLELEIIRSGYSMYSDHFPFWEVYYDAIFYAEYNFNLFYHSPEDTIENMNIPYAIRASKLIIATLAELAEIIGSSTPLKPDTPIGTSNGKTGEEYTYTTSTTDEDSNIIYYYWSWGDDTNNGWVGPYNSGEEINATHIWNEKGDYSIKVKAKDEDGYESEWSDPLEISMPRNKVINPLILQFLEHHPNMFPMLRQFLGLK